MSDSLHRLIDVDYGPDGDEKLRHLLASGVEINEMDEGEAPLHVAARRRRLSAVRILLDHGAFVDAKTAHGKTAYAHALRRGFDEVADLLCRRGADLSLTDADRFAVAVGHGRLTEAQQILAACPHAVRTGNPEEDRLLADMAGRSAVEAVEFLIRSGADLEARGLDSGTPLHQAAWFGQPANARLLLQAGAPVNDFEATHDSSPLGWAVHGARYSGGARERQKAYLALVKMLLEAGASVEYPGGNDGGAYLQRLHQDATPEVKALLPAAA